MKIMRKLRSALAPALDVPSGALGERVCVSTGGFFDTVVDGCDAIVDYSPCRVVLDCASERVVIEGDGLFVSVFALGRARICGRVDSITNYRGKSIPPSPGKSADGGEGAV